MSGFWLNTWKWPRRHRTEVIGGNPTRWQRFCSWCLGWKWVQL
jgi:hypothetical protein